MLKGIKFIFIKSRLVYKDKIGFCLMVEEIINGEEVKIVIILGKIIEDNGNWFVVYVVLVDFYK